MTKLGPSEDQVITKLGPKKNQLNPNGCHIQVNPTLLTTNYQKVSLKTSLEPL